MAEKEKKKKTKRPTAAKRDIRNAKRRDENKMFKSQVRTSLRRFDETLGKGDRTLASEALNKVYSLMDKGVKKGIYKLNKANRTKAQLAVQLKQKFS